MAELIQTNYDQLNMVANKFTEQCDQVAGTLKNITNRMSSLQGFGWEGRAAVAFFTEMGDEVLPQCSRLQSSLEQTSSTLKQIAAIVQSAEEVAANGFRVAAS